MLALQLTNLISHALMSTLPISLFLANWQTVAPLLGLTETDEEDVEEEENKTQDKRYKTLQRWKNKNLFKATYRVLVDVFLKLGRADLAEKVCRLLVNEGTCNISNKGHGFYPTIAKCCLTSYLLSTNSPWFGLLVSLIMIMSFKYYLCIMLALVPRPSHHPVLDCLQYAKLEGRPGPFYHVNDFNTTLGKQMVGWGPDRLNAFHVVFGVLCPA